MARSKWTETEARAALQAWRRSGQSLRQWALGQGLVPERLYAWRKKLGDPEPDVQLVEVKVAQPVRGKPVLVMLRSGHMLKVGRGFDEEAFARAVAVLERC